MGITNAIIIETDDLEPETVQAIHEAVAKVFSAASGMQPSPSAIQGWTPELAAELDARLRLRNRPVQADTIKSAAKAGGHVDRASVYELGGYDADRSVNGFTKPVRGVMKEMVGEGLLTPDAANPMEPDYDPNNPAYQRAKGFSMPADVAAVFAEASV